MNAIRQTLDKCPKCDEPFSSEDAMTIDDDLQHRANTDGKDDDAHEADLVPQDEDIRRVSSDTQNKSISNIIALVSAAMNATSSVVSAAINSKSPVVSPAMNAKSHVVSAAMNAKSSVVSGSGSTFSERMRIRKGTEERSHPVDNRSKIKDDIHHYKDEETSSMKRDSGRKDDITQRHHLHELIVETELYASAPLDPAKPNAVPLHDFVIRYVHNRNLLKPVARHPEDHHKPIIGSLVVVDNRPNVWSMLSVLVTLDNLDVRRWPRVVVFCAPENEQFVQRSLPPSLLPGGVELVTVVMESLSYAPPLPGQKPFSIEKYSNILKDASFWRRLKEVAVGDMALFVQDDGMIVRPGIEEDEEIMAQDYVGAPWADAPANAELKRLVPTLVGNGGLSLRRVDACLDVTEPTTTPVHRMSGGGRLFNFNLQPEPEDVFFARSFSTIGCGCPTGVGERFAMEQRISSSKVSIPFGFHKPWPYLPKEHVAEFMHQALDE
eukprot:gene6087-biopygen1226